MTKAKIAAKKFTAPIKRLDLNGLCREMDCRLAGFAFDGRDQRRHYCETTDDFMFNQFRKLPTSNIQGNCDSRAAKFPSRECLGNAVYRG